MCPQPDPIWILSISILFMYSWCPDEASGKEMVRVMFPLLFDATTEYIADNVSLHVHFPVVLSLKSF